MACIDPCENVVVANEPKKAKSCDARYIMHDDQSTHNKKKWQTEMSCLKTMKREYNLLLVC